MYRRIAAFAAASLMLVGQAAVAAEGARIAGATGSVMVSQNGRFVQASNGTLLRAGDRVVASSGSARVVYGDGCNVSVAARSMVTIGATSPCAGGSSVVKVSTAARDNDDRGGTAGYGTDTDFWAWLGFGVLTVGVTASALSDDSNPNSP